LQDIFSFLISLSNLTTQMVHRKYTFCLLYSAVHIYLCLPQTLYYIHWEFFPLSEEFKAFRLVFLCHQTALFFLFLSYTKKPQTT